MDDREVIQARLDAAFEAAGEKARALDDPQVAEDLSRHLRAILANPGSETGKPRE